MELLAVVLILGLFAAVAMVRIGPGTLSDIEARTEARRVAADLRQARRRSIATGDNHYLSFTTGAGGTVTGYTFLRRTLSGSIPVDQPHPFPADLAAVSSHAEAEFNFEGLSLASYQITLTGPHQTWRVTVVPATGTARVEPV